MKKERKQYLVNMDNVRFYEKTEDKFLLDFSPEQEVILRTCMKNPLGAGSLISVFAYPEISETRMGILYKVFRSDAVVDLKGARFHAPVKGIDVWKIIHTRLTDVQFELCLRCLHNGVNLIDDIKDVWTYSEDVFYYLYVGAAYGRDYCHLVHPGMDEKKLEKKVMTWKKTFERREKLYDTLHDFLEPSIGFRIGYFLHNKREKREKRKREREYRKYMKTIPVNPALADVPEPKKWRLFGR